MCVRPRKPMMPLIHPCRWMQRFRDNETLVQRTLGKVRSTGMSFARTLSRVPSRMVSTSGTSSLEGVSSMQKAPPSVNNESDNDEEIAINLATFES